MNFTAFREIFKNTYKNVLLKPDAFNKSFSARSSSCCATFRARLRWRRYGPRYLRMYTRCYICHETCSCFSNMNMKCTHDLKNVLFELTFGAIKIFNFGKKQKSQKSMQFRVFWENSRRSRPGVKECISWHNILCNKCSKYPRALRYRGPNTLSLVVYRPPARTQK